MTPVIESCRGIASLFGYAIHFTWLSAILYAAAIIIVLFHDTPTDLYVEYVPSKATWWGYLKSWIKTAAANHFVIICLSTLWSILTTLLFSLGTLLRWAFPKKPPDLQARRLKRARAALWCHKTTVRRTHSSTRLLAAAASGICLTAQAAVGCTIPHPPDTALRTVMADLFPPSPPSTFQQYISGMSLVINEAKATVPTVNILSTGFQWNADSSPVGVDNRASACISNVKADFEDDLEPVQRKVKTFNGTYHGQVYQGTLRWSVLDTQGRTHHWCIPNSYYIPEGGMRLFSPQHWAQERLKQGIEMKQ